MNLFLRDDLWQRRMRDEILAPAFYGKYALNGRYVFIDKGRLARSCSVNSPSTPGRLTIVGGR
jgi:hypothetical protein